MSGDDNEYRKKLIEDQLKMAIEYDKKVCWLSAGGIGLSITFMKDFIGNTQINDQLLVIISWSIMSLVLLLALINNLIGVFAYKNMLSLFDSKKFNENSGKKSIKNYSNWINGINIIHVFLICISLIALISFAIKNL